MKIFFKMLKQIPVLFISLTFIQKPIEISAGLYILTLLLYQMVSYFLTLIEITAICGIYHIRG